jgi:hypothetical protein
MIPTDRGSLGKPVYVALSASRPSIKDALGMILVTVLPVAIVILMQRPALRQSLVMRGTHVGKEFCRIQADFWNKAGDSFGTAYNKAKL